MPWHQNSTRQNQNTGPDVITGTPQKFKCLKEYPESWQMQILTRSEHRYLWKRERHRSLDVSKVSAWLSATYTTGNNPCCYWVPPSLLPNASFWNRDVTSLNSFKDPQSRSHSFRHWLGWENRMIPRRPYNKDEQVDIQSIGYKGWELPGLIKGYVHKLLYHLTFWFRALNSCQLYTRTTQSAKSPISSQAAYLGLISKGTINSQLLKCSTALLLLWTYTTPFTDT